MGRAQRQQDFAIRDRTKIGGNLKGPGTEPRTSGFTVGACDLRTFFWARQVTTMKTLLSSAATVLVLASTGYAQDTESRFLDLQSHSGAPFLFASDMIGATLYSTETEFEADATLSAEMQRELENIGEVDDVLLTGDGEVQALILGVGGFLGIGERDVALPISQVQMLRNAEDPADVRLVVQATRDQISNAPAFDRDTLGQMNAEGMETADGEQAQPLAETETMAEGSGDSQLETDTDVAADTDMQTDSGDAVAADTGTQTETGDDVAADTEMQTETDSDVAADTGMQTEEGTEQTADSSQMQETDSEAAAAEGEDIQALVASLQDAPVYGPNEDEIGTIVEVVMNDAGDAIAELVIDVSAYYGTDDMKVSAQYDEVTVEGEGEDQVVRVMLNAPIDSLPQVQSM